MPKSKDKKRAWLCFDQFQNRRHSQLTKVRYRLVKVYRHGDRSPIVIYPTDPNKEDKWPQGLGWLSKQGMEEQYNLGQWLRKRYLNTGFMSSSYKHDEIVILSSDEDRCLMSAYSNLAGLYPPSEEEQFMANISWQPIPVYTKPKTEDNMLNMGAECPRYDELLKQTLASHAVEAEEKQNKPFYEFLGNMTHWDHENITNIWRIADTTYCEKVHNLTLPAWINDTVYNKLRQLESFQFRLLYNGTEQSMLKGGPLLNEYIQNMQSKKQAGNSSVKMYMYSGHDTTVAALLSALQLFDGKSPQYTATVIAELHKNLSGQYYVNLFYKNETFGDTAHPLTLQGCETDCPLDKFVTLTKNAVPTDWPSQCGIPSSSGSSSQKLTTGWIVTIALGAILLIIVVVNVICFLRLRKKNDAFLYGKFDVSS